MPPSLPISPGAERQSVRADRLTRRILVMVLLLQALGIGLVAALLMVAADGQDRVAEAASRRAVQSALAAVERRIGGLANDSGNWDEAVEALHVDRDVAWFEKYFNQEFADSMEIEDVFVVGADGRVSFAFTRNADDDHQAAVDDAGLRRLIAAARALPADTTPLAAAGFVLIDGAIHVAGASRLRYTDDSRSPAGNEASILIFARCLDTAGLAALAADHALEPLAMLTGAAAVAPPPRGEARAVIGEFGSGEAIGALAWQPQQPGGALLRRAAPMAAAALAAMLLLLLLIAGNARRAGHSLDAAHWALVEARATLESKVTQRTEALRQAEARLRGVIEHAAEGIFQLAEDGRYLDVNPAMAAIFGYASVEHFLAHAPDHTRQDPDKMAEFARLIGAFGKVSDFVSRARRLDAQPIWIAQNTRLVEAADGSRFYEGMLTDITQRKRIEAQLVHDALHDPLTSLPNRRLFEERLSQALARSAVTAAAAASERPAVLLLDCDRFKLINDSLGHSAGDELLILLAQRLSRCLRRPDTLARLGGDEFAVLLERGGGGAGIALADRLQAVCRRPFQLRDREVFMCLSIGVAEAPNAAADPSELVRNADIAMYQARARGRGNTVAFTPDMHVSVLNRLRVESDLRRAIANDELIVVYQPIIALDGGSLAGFEALVRWQHPERGLIAPADFIAIAEESRLIQPLGEIVLRRAVEDMVRWLADSGWSRPMFVSVNLSPFQLEEDDLVPRVAALLAATGLSPERLKLEITETAMMTNPVAVRAKLAALDAIGVRLSIDDFGTGYSSLSQLYSYPFDTLKIDRSFVSKMMSDADGLALVRSILGLAANLRLAVVAEGVEDKAQRDWLAEQGCTFGQGYLFARPLAATDAARLLRQPPAKAVA